jgi:hypothetical protein
MYQKNDGTTRKVLRPTERVGTGPYLKTSSTYDVHQNQCLHAMHTLTRLHRFKPFLVVNHVQKIAYIALANAQKTSMPCQNLEFDRDF